VKRERTGPALAVLAALSVLLGVLAWTLGRSGDSTPSVEGDAPIEAHTVVSPRNALFGDTVTARVDVIVDRERVDPNSVRIRTEFAPWKPIVAPERLRRDGGSSTYLGTTFVLRCLETACTSASDAAKQQFSPARVTFTLRGEPASTADGSTEVQWPEFVVRARFSQAAARSAGANPWRANLLSLPEVSYGLTPGALLVLLLGGSLLLATVGGLLAYRILRRRAPAPIPQVAAASGPTALQRALAFLEDPTRVNGAPKQRRALEFVSEPLRERGAPKLARRARVLAWSRPVPGVEETSGVAVEARSVLGEEPHAHGA
jgi:hypothetical protein